MITIAMGELNNAQQLDLARRQACMSNAPYAHQVCASLVSQEKASLGRAYTAVQKVMAAKAKARHAHK